MVTGGKGPLALIILDGFGYSASREGNAIAQASMPFYDELSAKYPRTLIEVSGTCVGLPAGIMGNSEVGHLNMGAGRVIRTDIARIDHAISTGEFFSNPALVQAMDNARANNSSLHLMGLLSNGMVHSSQDHLYALLELARRRGIERVFIHAFLDGRDVPPWSAEKFLDALNNQISHIGRGRLATICGRYYAMDRDKRWDRTERAYRALVHGEGMRANDAHSALA